MSVLSLPQHGATVGVKRLRCFGLHTQLYAEQKSCTLFYAGMFQNGVLILMSVGKQTTSRTLKFQPLMF